MNLTKWFRKNNKKLMAIVVVFLMVAFVGGSWLNAIQRRRAMPKEARAYYGDGRKIMLEDLIIAQQELNILQSLQATNFLTGISLPFSRDPRDNRSAQDIQPLLISELLFPNQQNSAGINSRLKRDIKQKGYLISEKQVNDIYRPSRSREIYWFLLKKEAERAGIMASNESAKTFLNDVLRQLSQINPQLSGVTYKKLMESVVKEHHISEERALEILGKLISVWRHTNLVCTNENVTTPQILFEAGRMTEVMNISLVNVDSAVFAEAQPEPSREEILSQFEKFKDSFTGTVTQDNPYGFGYKSDDRVVLEYIAIKLDDVKEQVPVPTEEEKEKFYQRYKEQFSRAVPSDPNDPNSQPIQQIMSYAEVAHIVSQQLTQRKINVTASEIMRDAKSLADVGFAEFAQETKKVKLEDLKAKAVDYNKIAADLTDKFNVKVYSGMTGQLSANDFRGNKYLSSLFIAGQGRMSNGFPVMVPLSRIVFAVDQIDASELGPFDVSMPRMYENLGPFRDALAGEIMMLARIVDAKKSFEPESVDQTFSTRALDLGEPEDSNSPDVYSVAEQVTKDLKRLSAMETTAKKADEFVELTRENGWDNAIEKFNELYGEAFTEKTGEPNAFTLLDLTDMSRLSSLEMESMSILGQGNPGASLLLESGNIERLRREKLYSLIPADKTTIPDLPVVVEFKPNMSYYVIKEITIGRLDQKNYETTKSMIAFLSQDRVQSQSMAAVYLNPDNILKRMKFKDVRQQNEKNEAAIDNSSSGEDTEKDK
ncbi:MAG: hypothetical protein ACYTBP_12990 [Planctomycetota bacterium]|jgi:hypothetical protein